MEIKKFIFLKILRILEYIVKIIQTFLVKIQIYTYFTKQYNYFKIGVETKRDFNPNFVLHVKYNKTIDKCESKRYKVFKYPSKWNFDQVLLHILKQNPIFFPHLFIFVVEAKTQEDFNAVTNRLSGCEGSKVIKDYFKGFKASRPIIFQINLENDNKSVFYFKEKNVSNFVNLNDNKENYKDLFEILCKPNDDIIENLHEVKHSSVILRFLRALVLPEVFFRRQILECALNGSKNDLLALLDASFEDEGRRLNNEAQNILTYTFDKENTISVLSQAVQNPDKNVTDFLIANCTHLIQQLPFHHRVNISTSVYKAKNTKVLISLINNSDFPFPKDLDESNIHDRNFLKLINKRRKFHESISNGQDIEKFIKENSNLKIVFNVNNQTSLYNTLASKKFKCYSILKSKGFQMDPSEKFPELTDEETKQFNIETSTQTKQNVEKAVPDRQKSAKLLAARSLIHNRKIGKKKEELYRKKIKEWFNKLCKIQICSIFLDCVAQCDDLKIIFDFESESVENVDLKTRSNSHGIIYPKSQIIFIGAKENENKDTFKVEGVLIHEISHFVMRLIFENNDNPYFENDHIAKEEFKRICDVIRTMIYDNFDDGCLGIVSSVYNQYNEEDLHPELVVRPLQILAQFNGEQKTLNHLKEQYKELFEYIKNFILPEIRIFNLENRKMIKKINDSTDILSKIKKLTISFSSSKVANNMFESNHVIVKANVPKLFLLDLYQHLYQKESVISKNNIFVPSNLENNKSLFNEIKKISKTNKALKIIVNCMDEPQEAILKFFNAIDNPVILVISKHHIKSLNISHSVLENSLIEDFNYTFDDLSEECRQNLLNIKINYQNNQDVTLNNLLTDQIDPKFIIDDEYLNSAVNNLKILINSNTNNDLTDINSFYQSRRFIECCEKGSEDKIKLSEDELLSKVKNYAKILISDSAKTGKSWTMQKIANCLRQKYPNNWVSLVDLKQHLKTFGEQKLSYDFEDFMINHILELSNTEINIFKQFYIKGRVFILFDGFNEIQEEFRKNFQTFCDSFSSNGGNQLWITTRDYCKDKLLNNLPMDAGFQLEPFSNESGVELISLMWKHQDDNANCDQTSIIKKTIFKESIEIFQEYQKKAENICQSILKFECQNINLPIFYKVIAQHRKDIESSHNTLTFKILITLIAKSFEKFHDEKFRNIHQLYAIKNLFPELKVFCNIDISNILDEDSIEFGLLKKCNDIFVFQNRGFGCFFVVDFIITKLYKIKIIEENDNFPKIFTSLLKSDSFQTIRMLLNGALSEEESFKNFEIILRNCTEQIVENILKIFDISFEEKLQNFTKIYLRLLKEKEYFKVRKILNKHIKILIENANDELYLQNLLNIIAEYLKMKDFKYLIRKHKILHKIMCLNIKVENLVKLIKVLETKINSDYVRNIMRNEDKYGSLLHYLCKFKDFDKKVFEHFFSLLDDFLRKNEIIQILGLLNKSKENLIFICVASKDKEKLKFIFSKLKSYLDESLLKNMIKDCSVNYISVLHSVTSCDKKDFHNELWNILLTTINDKNELKEFIQQKDKNGDTFLHLIVKYQNSDVVNYTFTTIIEECKNLEILRSKNASNMNLLHQAICYLKDFEALKYVWFFLKNSFKKEILLEIIKEKDHNSNNVIHASAAFSNPDVLEFIINEVKTVTSQTELEELIIIKNDKNQNILELAASNNLNYLQNIMSKLENFKILNEKKTEIIVDQTNSNDEISNTIKFHKINKSTFKYQSGKDIFLHPDVKYRTIICLSIVGHYRKGKSFFLNYCLRYLYANYPTINNGDKTTKKEWIGDENEPLDGFHWKSGIQRDTTGIVIWNDVFLHTDEKTGEKQAIIVIDSHGLFDNQTSSQDNKKYYALQALLSSILILNYSGTIEKDQLQPMRFATELAQYAALNFQNKSGDFFQNLMFLVRDWPYNEQHAYGIEGGKYYLEGIFESINDQNKELQHVGENINQTFENVTCSLLPHPGFFVIGTKKINGVKYNGNHKVMEEEFKDELCKTVEYLLKPENLISKKINGQSVKGWEYLNKIEKCFELFESNELLEVRETFNAIVRK